LPRFLRMPVTRQALLENGEKVYLNNKTIQVDGRNPWADSLKEGKGVAEIRNEYVHRLFDNHIKKVGTR